MTGERRSLLVAAVVLGLLLVSLEHLLRADRNERNWEVFTEMAYSVAGESFMASDAFADGRLAQPLVAGVVTRGRLPFGYEATPEDAERAGRELLDPLPPGDANVLAQGASLFAVYCVPCHDARGNGRGPAVLRGMLPPPSLHGDRAKSLLDGQLFHVLTLGQGNMASYAAQLSPDERWAVIRHVRRMQEEGP